MGYAANGFCFDTPDAAAAYACGHDYPLASVVVDGTPPRTNHHEPRSHRTGPDGISWEQGASLIHTAQLALARDAAASDLDAHARRGELGLYPEAARVRRDNSSDGEMTLQGPGGAPVFSC